MKLETRRDRGVLNLGVQVVDKLHPRTFEGVVARTHSPEDPLTYHTGPEHRNVDELARIVSQLPGLPLVTYAEPSAEVPVGHPDGLIDELGVDYVQIGIVVSAEVIDNKAVAQIHVYNEGALAQIEDGITELSLGYRCGLLDGRWQTATQLNHLSLVPKARCGSVCSLRVDSLDAEPSNEPRPAKCGCSLATTMPDATIAPVIVSEMEVALKVVLDDKSKALLASLGGLEIASGEEPEVKTDCACKNHAEVLNTGDLMTAEDQKKIDDALAEVATLKSEIESLKTAAVKADEATELALTQAQADLKAEKAAAEKLAGEIEAIKTDAAAKIDAAQKARTDADEEVFAARVDARVALLDAAAKVGVEATGTDRAIKVAIVAKVDEIEIDEKKSADYVDASFAGAMKRFEKAATSVAAIRGAIEENKTDAEEAVVVETDNEAELRSAMEAKRANKWRPGK